MVSLAYGSNRRRFEEWTYATKDGKEIKYKVYYIEGRDSPAIEESECLNLAFQAGCHSFRVSRPVQAFDDIMFYSSKAQQKKFGIIAPRANRYVAYCECIGFDDKGYEALGNAAPDNVDMVKNYLPEMAMKRARVRCAILALGLKGLNADVEFADQDKTYGASPSEQNAAEVLAKKAERLKKIKELFDEMGLTKTKEDLKKKKELLEECGINVPHNAMTVPQLDDFIKFLERK